MGCVGSTGVSKLIKKRPLNERVSHGGGQGKVKVTRSKMA